MTEPTTRHITDEAQPLPCTPLVCSGKKNPTKKQEKTYQIQCKIMLWGCFEAGGPQTLKHYTLAENLVASARGL